MLFRSCTSTHHKSWQACPIKQVNADRLERYILENLERISLDQNYIDNLVFKLNHSLDSSNLEFKKSSPAHQAGFELTKVCSKLEPETIVSILKSFLLFLSQRRRVERNLLAKKFIEKIIYSKENIKISLFYSEILKNFAAQKSPARLTPGGASARSADEENIISSKNSQFEADNVTVSLG